MTLRPKQPCKSKLTLLSGTLMFRLKEKFPVFHFFTGEVRTGEVRIGEGKLSQVTLPYKVVINNHSITI